MILTLDILCPWFPERKHRVSTNSWLCTYCLKKSRFGYRENISTKLPSGWAAAEPLHHDAHAAQAVRFSRRCGTPQPERSARRRISAGFLEASSCSLTNVVFIISPPHIVQIPATTVYSRQGRNRDGDIQHNNHPPDRQSLLAILQCFTCTDLAPNVVVIFILKIN